MIIPDVPRSLSLPVLIVLPGSPVISEFPVGDLLVVPGMPLPVMISVIGPPLRVYIVIERRHLIVISPVSVVIRRTVPIAVP